MPNSCETTPKRCTWGASLPSRAAMPGCRSAKSCRTATLVVKVTTVTVEAALVRAASAVDGRDVSRNAGA